jgi:hypothetical protein
MDALDDFTVASFYVSKYFAGVVAVAFPRELCERRASAPSLSGLQLRCKGDAINMPRLVSFDPAAAACEAFDCCALE